jgi:hypothetical protein
MTVLINVFCEVASPRASQLLAMTVLFNVFCEVASPRWGLSCFQLQCFFCGSQ